MPTTVKLLENRNSCIDVTLRGSDIVKVVTLEAAKRSRIGIGEYNAELCTKHCRSR